MLYFVGVCVPGVKRLDVGEVFRGEGAVSALQRPAVETKMPSFGTFLLRYKTQFDWFWIGFASYILELSELLLVPS